MENMEQIRMAGNLVGFLEAWGCFSDEIDNIIRYMQEHQKKQMNTEETTSHLEIRFDNQKLHYN